MRIDEGAEVTLCVITWSRQLFVNVGFVGGLSSEE
jgi:hypothetical protein